MPTDTVWGVIADATSETAIQRAIQLKGGGSHRGMIILVADLDMLSSTCTQTFTLGGNLADLHRRPDCPLSPNAGPPAKIVWAAWGMGHSDVFDPCLHH